MLKNMEDIIRFFEQRQVKLGMNFGLTRMEALLSKMGNPHQGLPYIHLAGSNGKGSTLHFIKEILMAKGLKVASFTSPYLVRMNEQIKVGRKEITDEEFAEEFRTMWPIIEEMDARDEAPTQFEILTALAFSYFSKQKADYILIETGLGGRLDTTNVIQPLVSVITSISLEHTQILGDTLGEIAAEKAGIIKRGAPVISGVREPEPAQVIEEKAKEKTVPYYQLGKELILSDIKQTVGGQSFSYSFKNRIIEDIDMHMLGRHQAENAALAISAVLLVLEGIEDRYIREGLKLASWKGRFEKMSDHPLVFIDGAHNPAGISVLLDTLKRRYPYHEYHFVFSSFRDKDFTKMLDMLVREAKTITVTEFSHERAASAEELLIHHDGISMDPDWQHAIRQRTEALSDNQLLVITGSLYFLSLVRKILI